MARPNWLNDTTLVIILFVILGILSIVQIISLRSNIEHTQKLQEVNQVTECLDPTTVCGEELARREIQERMFFRNLMRNTGICTLFASRELGQGTISFEEADLIYDECLESRTGPPPPTLEEPLPIE